MDSNYYLSILYERLKDMNDLGGSDWSLKFNRDPNDQNKIVLDYLRKKISNRLLIHQVYLLLKT